MTAAEKSPDPAKSRGRHLAQARGFLFAGTMGFVIDAVVLTALHNLGSVPLLPARLLSFGTAVTATWLLNRRYTFADRHWSPLLSEWLRYVLVNSVGATINLGIFFLVVGSWPAAPGQPVLALAVASLTALGVNFFGSKYVAFQYHRLRIRP